MRTSFDNSSGSHEAPHSVVVARFENAADAAKARDSLEEMFDELAEEVSQLFEKNGGAAHVFEITRIYATRGLHNDSGWEQELPVLTHEKDLAWTLPAGAHAEDAENLLWTLGAQDVTVHQQNLDDEDWKLAPHPMAMSIPEDDFGFYERDDEEPGVRVASRKRTLH